MERAIGFRHNVIKANSIDNFLDLRGSLSNNIRDVYFVRGIGESKNFIDTILEADRKMSIEMSKNTLSYIRLKKLPNIVDRSDISFYSEQYDTWKNTKRFSLKKIALNESLLKTASKGYGLALELFSITNKKATASIVRNLGIKLLFWLDNITYSVFKNWSETRCIKVICENILKEQEYIFFYFLTLLGCDVLLLENKEDIVLDKALEKISYRLELGPYGYSEICEYVPFKYESNLKPSVESNRSEKIRVVIPERNRHSNNRHSQATTVIEAIPPRTERREKTFEELASLAKSIVMIGIHDRKGEIIGSGSGIMIGEQGYILTNNHVVAGAVSYSIRIEDEENIYETDEFIKYNQNIDLAIIRINRRLTPLKIFDGKGGLARGQRVVAIGSPLGLFNSVSDGIISGFRKIDDVDLIQFTAPTSPGSSGGAVLNMYGEVIGISKSGFGNAQNINLAVTYENILMFARGFMR